MRFAIALRAVCAMALSVAAYAANVDYDAANHRWTLRTGPVEYRLIETDGIVRPESFGPSGQVSWLTKDAPPGSDIAGSAEGQSLSPENLRLVRAAIDGAAELVLHYEHRRLPLEIEARYIVHGDTGVITRRLLLTNRGAQPLHIETAPSLALQFPAGDYELSYLWGGWGQERQLATEPLSIGRRVFTADCGRSTNGYASWFALHDRGRGVWYVAQLAWSGNWQMRFSRDPAGDRIRPNQLGLAAELGMRFDFGGPLALAPGESFTLPEVAFTAASGDLDDVANQLHRYQRTLIPRRPSGEPLLVQFNSWYPYAENVSAAELKRAADAAAAIGAETFVVDSGWYVKQDWSRELGDYQVNRAKFPDGLEDLARYVRAKGMKFGLWVEIENAGIDSQLVRQHPDWFLSYNGAPILKDQRHQLDFALPAVRQWARATVDRLIRDYGLEWLKIDYNVDIGDRFDAPDGGRAGDVLYRHIVAYYAWLDELRAAHPELLVESCASGGLRFDLGILAHAHTTWLSDVVAPGASAQLAYGCNLEFTPEVCNHWMVGDDDHGHVDLAKPAGWWDFMFRVPMNGQFGVSSRVVDWPPALRQRAAENIAIYKRLRTVIDGADVYHLTPQPTHNDPRGWMAIQYVSAGARRSVVLAYRLAGGEAQQTFHLRGLGAKRYAVAVDGQPAGEYGAAELAGRGLPVKLDEDWRAAVFELRAVE